MKTQYLLVAFVILSFSVLLAQETKEKISVKSLKTTSTKVAKQSINNTYAIDKINSTSTVATYDFTVAGAAYTTGPDPMVEVETGVWAMIAGDANGDGGVYAEDYTAYQTNQGNENYNAADFNMDGGVYAEDYTIYQLNQGKESQVPQ